MKKPFISYVIGNKVISIDLENPFGDVEDPILEEMAKGIFEESSKIYAFHKDNTWETISKFRKDNYKRMAVASFLKLVGVCLKYDE